jgi:predicted Fe-Mo cluster-binding NifX family protein
MSTERPIQPAEQTTASRREPGVMIRERRLGSITGYRGTAERSFTQVGMCSSFCATLRAVGRKSMSLKVALAVSADGTLLEHFGQAERFAVYELGSHAPRQTEIRQATRFCHQEDKVIKAQDVAELLSDCCAVVCAAIGPCARLELGLAEVESFEYQGPIADVLRTMAGEAFVKRLSKQTKVSRESIK